jgi:hypothetical protein
VIGVGAGTDTIAFCNFGMNVIGIDKEYLFDMVRHHGRDINPSLSPQLLGADMLDLPFLPHSAQLVTSMGVYEHYSDEIIVHGIRESLRVAPKSVFMVPTDQYQGTNKRLLGLTATMGDERMMATSKWETLILRAGAVIQRKFGYWDPKLRNTFTHPTSLEECYGKGLLAVYTIVRSR